MEAVLFQMSPLDTTFLWNQKHSYVIACQMNIIMAALNVTGCKTRRHFTIKFDTEIKLAWL